MTRTLKGFTLAAALTVMFAPGARAQVAPAGALYDFAVDHPGVLSSYMPLSVSFTASLASTTVSFAFREVPAYWGFDNASVVDVTASGPNELVDPGFEAATVGLNVPDDGWSRWIQPIDVSAIGQISSAGQPSGCVSGPASGGNNFWCDGSVEGYDALYQTIATTPGDVYTISWDMSDDSGVAPGVPYPYNCTPDVDCDWDANGINMFVYAQDGIPVGTIQVSGTPEPATLSLMATGLLGLVGVARRRRRNG